MISAVKTILVGLATAVGVFAVAAQALDYLTTGKLDILLIGITLASSVVPIVVIIVIMVRQGKGSDRVFRGISLEW